MSESIPIEVAKKMAMQAVSISSKDEVVRRRPIYVDVEELISPGFLTQQVLVGGTNLSLRSLGPGDFVLLRHRVGLNATSRAWKEWAVASAIWMVDGQSLLGDVNAPAKLRASLASLPGSGLDSLFSVYTAIHNRVRVAISRLEAFCYEDFSRATWRMFACGNPARDDVAGVVGVSSLGMNHIQRMWVAFNHSEDDRQTWQREWTAAKLAVWATAPKGVRKLNMRDESERKLETEQRQRVIAKTYHEATGRPFEETGGMVVHRAITPEELVEEMNRWVRGEKDQHDEIIDSYKNMVREKHDLDRQQHEARMAELGRIRDEVGATGGMTFVGHTLEQIRELQGVDGGLLPRIGTPVVSSSDAGRLYDKFVASDIPVGAVATHGAVPLPSSDEGSLTNATRNRRVHMRDGGA